VTLYFYTFYVFELQTNANGYFDFKDQFFKNILVIGVSNECTFQYKMRKQTLSEGSFNLILIYFQSIPVYAPAKLPCLLYRKRVIVLFEGKLFSRKHMTAFYCFTCPSQTGLNDL
jgi:hypothetical protein